jgi:hypothetical protein
MFMADERVIKMRPVCGKTMDMTGEPTYIELGARNAQAANWVQWRRHYESSSRADATFFEARCLSLMWRIVGGGLWSELDAS